MFSYRNKHYFNYASLLILVLAVTQLASCDQNVSQRTEVKPTVAEVKVVKPVVNLVVLDAAPTINEIAKQGGTCNQNWCTSETGPGLAPLKRSTGAPLCMPGRFNINAFAVIHMSADGHPLGATCEITESTYSEIVSLYGTANIDKKYVDQKLYQDFMTWKTDHGFVTTFREISGRAPSGPEMYDFMVYAGSVELPRYSGNVAK